MSPKAALVVEYQVGRDFSWLTIPGTNPTIGIPAYSEAAAHNFGSRITRGKDIAEDYLHIPVTVDMRMRFRLPDPITPPEQLTGWHPYLQVSHGYYLRMRDLRAWSVRTVKEDDRTGYFAARPTYALANRNRLTRAA